MDINKFLLGLTQLLILFPGAESCYLAVKNRMKFSYTKTAALCAAVIIPYSIAAASVYALFSIDINIMLLPSLVLFFFLYRRTVNMDIPRSLAIYIGICARLQNSDMIFVILSACLQTLPSREMPSAFGRT